MLSTSISCRRRRARNRRVFTVSSAMPRHSATSAPLIPSTARRTVLAVGLKVDVEALPEEVRRAIRQGKVDLNNPATTLALLKLNAEVGVTGIFSENHGSLGSVGIQRALCH